MAALRQAFVEGVRVSAIMSAGDALAQLVLEKKPIDQYDYVRTGKFAAVGFCFVGPTLRLWYGKLDKLIKPEPSALKRGLKKMALDQICCAPLFCLAITGVVGTVNGESPTQIMERLKNDYFTIMLNGYKLWPAAQIINFAIVPVKHQVTYAQFIAIAWNCYLSMMLNNESKVSDKGDTS